MSDQVTESEPMTLDALDAATDYPAYTVAGYGGVAFHYWGRQTERYWDEDEGISWDEPEERETGMARMVMVGDDHVHIIDPEDVTAIPEDDYCASCGQVGCTADGRDR